MSTALPRIAAVRKTDAPTWVRPEALNVTPDLLGVPLARPSRRAMAIGIDCLVVALLSSTGTFWVPAGAAALIFQLRRRHAEHVHRGSVWLWLALSALVFVAGLHTMDYIEGRGKSPTEAAASDDDADLDEAAALLGAPHTAASDAASTPADGAASRPTPETAAQHAAALRIAKLEAELAEARKPRPLRWRDDVVKSAHSIGLGFGWAIAYFTLLPFWWKGQTLGKKLFGLRVVELTGKPLSLMSCFGRYGGYAAGMATGGVGFAQVLWDANRQAIQDKIAHTVVVDLRHPRRDVGAPVEDAALPDPAPVVDAEAQGAALPP